MLRLVMTRLSDVVYMLKRTVPMTDSCGTPNCIYLGHDREPYMLILWYWFDKYELNHIRAVSEIPKCMCTLCHDQLYQNAAEISSKLSTVEFPLSMLHDISLWILRRAVSVG